MEFIKLSDEEIYQLVVEVKEGSELAFRRILEYYKGFIKELCKGYFMKGSSREDLLQVAYIGLYEALLDVDLEKKDSIDSFLLMCIRRRIVDAIKKANRKKHSPLNNSCSLDTPVTSGNDSDSETTLMDCLQEESMQEMPEEIYIYNENLKRFNQMLAEVLTDYEYQAADLFYGQGLSYEEISQRLGTNYKSVDNSLSRVRRKMKKYFAEAGPDMAYTILAS